MLAQKKGSSLTEELVLERTGPVTTLLLNRPHRHNALTLDMFRQLPSFVEQAAADPETKVIVVRGAGERAFASGADIREFVEIRADSAGVRAHNEAVAAAENALVSAPVPTIAMVRGYCIGGGCGLALACDMRFADTTARLAITPAKLGIVYSLEGTRRLVEEVGPSEAKRMLMSAEQLDAESALRAGLVNELKEPGELETYTYEYARLLASRAQNSVRAAKEFVNRITSGQRHEDEYTEQLGDSVAESPEYEEGVRAFLEGRPPDFP